MTRIIREYPTLAEISTDPADVSYLLSLANDMRAKKGDEQLKDLPESAPREQQSCIIANAFNYGCSVTPNTMDFDAGHIVFNTSEDREIYLKIVEIDAADLENWLERHHDIFGDEDAADLYHAPLTDELNQIAIDFDNGVRFVEYVTSEPFAEKRYWVNDAVEKNNFALTDSEKEKLYGAFE